MFSALILVALSSVVFNFADADRYFKTPRITCVHGDEENGKCICDNDYVGTHCQFKMMCSSYERHLNGTCISCMEGYTGNRCESIDCLHGAQKVDVQECICEKPYGGKFCNELDTKDVYYFYNKKILILGPLGILSLFPLVAIYYGCEYYARKRQIKRVTNTLDVHNIVVKTKAVKKLLLSDV
ncbi:hypothetical protein L596_016883 [Steinernema carpocapsae]|uniref:EGF-like domain-containing protein n=1 Tax=Steinernema carpocapsae TaxID=34508 RepID=A0A4U5NL06_STECR|nr:hypothetical protein L596_016883 [Steinernema carpocapsae]